MDYEIVEQIDFDKNKAGRIGAFWYDKEKDAFYHESPWWFPVQLMAVNGLSKLYVTPMMVKLPFILKGWINIDILMRQIELISLVLQDKILMHASCVDSTLIVGFPNAGKTYQTYKMRAEGGTLISEEYTIISKSKSGKNWVAEPYKPVMRSCFSKKTIEVGELKLTLKERIWLFFSTVRAWIFPFMYEAVIWREIPVSGEKANIKKIVYGSTGGEIKDWQTFAILCENEFPFMANEFLQGYAVGAKLPLIDIQNRQRKLIKDFVGDIYA